jgi:hypothetical protein
MAMIDFAFEDRRRVAELYLSYREAGGSARISGYGSFTMVIAQFSHFWESAITAYLSTSAADVKAHSLDRIAELLNPPLRALRTSTRSSTQSHLFGERLAAGGGAGNYEVGPRPRSGRPVIGALEPTPHHAGVMCQATGTEIPIPPRVSAP